MVSGFWQGYSGIQRRDPPWLIFSAWDDQCVEGASAQPKEWLPVRAKVEELGPQSKRGGFGGEGTGHKTYIEKEWHKNRTHALLLSASRKVGSTEGRDCQVSAWYRSESKASLADVDPWLLVATIGFGCDAHPFLGAYR